MIADSSLSLHCKSIVVHLWHIPCIDMVYPCHILLLSLPSHNFPVKPLHPTKELFCASQLLIEALDAFKLMETRFYLENIFLGYTRYIPGISTEKVYTWYIPGIYHEKTLWGFQMHVPPSLASRLRAPPPSLGSPSPIGPRASESCATPVSRSDGPSRLRVSMHPSARTPA